MNRLSLIPLVLLAGCTTMQARVEKAVRITASACRGILAEPPVEPELQEACDTVLAVVTLLPRT